MERILNGLCDMQHHLNLVPDLTVRVLSKKIKMNKAMFANHLVL